MDETRGDYCVQSEGLEVCLPTLTAWGLVVRKSRIQAHKGVFILSSISLPASLEGTKVLRAELYEQSHIAPLPTVKMREGAVQYLGDSIVGGPVWPVGELQRVNGGR